jgi:signal transduction histidine kinase
MPRVDPASLADLAGREPSMAAFVDAGAVSYLIAPLLARGRTLGAVSLIACEPARAFGPHDLRLAEDLAHRLAVALDNARLYREAQDANRMKDEFLAVVSHELRTPLNAILGWSQLLHRGEMDEPSVAQGMGAIERNAKAQARIIDDVLDVSRIIQGKLRLEVQPVSLCRVLDEAVDVLRPAADAKKIQLETRLDASGSDEVVGDPGRLRQVVWNLLSNALKFTPDGGRVELSLAAAGTGAARQLELRVRDSGVGIEPAFLPHVFERFRQADSSSTRAHGGLGLGLAIVRHLVELHGGSVEADSEGPGRGATFTVRLPASPQPRHVGADRPGGDTRHGAAASAADADGHPQTDLTGLRVLLVEDEADARDAFASMLELCGAEVLAVATAHDALNAFRARRPDVLLSDIGMPGEDGYTLIRKVRALEGADPSPGGGDGDGADRPPRRTPAMALTAFAGAEDRRRAIRAGYQMHVPKPVGSAQFTAAVATLARDADAAPTLPGAAPA